MAQPKPRPRKPPRPVLYTAEAAAAQVARRHGKPISPRHFRKLAADCGIAPLRAPDLATLAGYRLQGDPGDRAQFYTSADIDRIVAARGPGRDRQTPPG